MPTDMPANLHVRNARIWTADPNDPWEAAVAIERGRVTKIGASSGRRAPGDRVIDAEGRTVLPGLFDAHVHLLLGGLSLARLDLSETRSRGDFELAIARRHAELPPGHWLIAGGWSSERWPGGVLPDHSWLAAAGDRPVVCHRNDLHATLVNQAVLDRLDTSGDPPGGTIVRAADGGPTGLLLEAAAWKLVNPIVPRPETADRQAAVLRAQRHCHRHGITTVGSMEYWRDLQEVFEPLRDRLTLRCRITLLDRTWPLDPAPGRDHRGDERLAVVGYKAFLDGTLNSRTARFLRDYDDQPGHRGLLVELGADGHLLEWARAVAAAGLSPSIHAIGDEAVRMALEAAEAVGPAGRTRIEHAQHVDPVDLPRFAGVIASMQPLHRADDGRYAVRRVGAARLAGCFAFRSLQEAGARLAFGSDWPVVACDPIAGLRAAVTGRTLGGGVFQPQENLTLDDALVAYTRGAAEALGASGSGRLRPGGPGDLVMLDRDPWEADWLAAPPRVVLTVAAGHVVYDAAVAEEAGELDGP